MGRLFQDKINLQPTVVHRGEAHLALCHQAVEHGGHQVVEHGGHQVEEHGGQPNPHLVARLVLPRTLSGLEDHRHSSCHHHPWVAAHLVVA